MAAGGVGTIFQHGHVILNHPTHQFAGRPMGGRAVSAAVTPCCFASTRYIAGTTNSVNNVPKDMPLAITSPRFERLTAPAPDAVISGTTPSTMAPVVISIGRRRIPDAFSIA